HWEQKESVPVLHTGDETQWSTAVHGWQESFTPSSWTKKPALHPLHRDVASLVHVTCPTQPWIGVHTGHVSGVLGPPLSRYRPVAHTSHCDVLALAHWTTVGLTHPSIAGHWVQVVGTVPDR